MIWNRLLCNILVISLAVIVSQGEDESGTALPDEMIALCQKNCNNGVDCTRTMMLMQSNKCVCKPGYKNNPVNSKCQLEVKNDVNNQGATQCVDDNGCRKSETCLGNICLGKCRIHDCGKGLCKVNETHPKPTCVCDKGYQLNRQNKCEDLCSNVVCPDNRKVCFYGSCVDFCLDVNCPDSEMCVLDLENKPFGKCIARPPPPAEPSTITPEPTKTTEGITNSETLKPKLSKTTGKPTAPTSKTGTTTEVTGSVTDSVTSETATPISEEVSSSTFTAKIANITNATATATTATGFNASSTVSTTTEETVPTEPSDHRNKKIDSHVFSGSDTSPSNPEPKLTSQPESGINFPIIFMASIVLVVAAYFLYHNRTKLIALVIEGRNGGGEGRYSKLKNVEDAMPRLRNAKASV